MRKTRDILRQKLDLGLSHRDVARSLQVSVGSVSKTVQAAEAADLLDWSEVSALGDEKLVERLFGPRPSRRENRPLPDFARLHIERRKKGVTLELLHLEYLEAHPDGYRYTRFCELFAEWCEQHRVSMRHVHRAGEKMFIDYSGATPHYADPETGERVECELFVAVLGASDFAYAEVTHSQQLRDWLGSHVRAFEYFGGVSKLLVPDQLRSGVARPCRYEPEVNRSYLDLATHYDTAVLPARPRKPKDKAKAESGVKFAQTWILARLRNETHFSLAELNESVAERLEELNDRPMKMTGKSRRQLFEELERDALLPLPARPYEFAEWHRPLVDHDYHVRVDYHDYSVPSVLVGQTLDVRLTATIVEVLRKGNRVVAHVRSFEKGGRTTLPEHLPKAHRKHLEWSPSRLIAWGMTVGPHTGELVRQILEARPHPEQGYRSCLGLRRLEGRYGQARLEAACERAVVAGALSYRHVDRILKNGLDRLPAGVADDDVPRPTHENVRGADYYDISEGEEDAD